LIAYAAYGSNMNRQQMLDRTNHEAEPIGTALLRDWQLAFRWGVLTVVPRPGGVVPLVLWQISDAARQELDYYEGAPRVYAPRMLPVSALELLTEISADKQADEYLIYEMTATGRNAVSRAGAPSTAYYDTCVQGYLDFGLQEWSDMLMAARERSLTENTRSSDSAITKVTSNCSGTP